MQCCGECQLRGGGMGSGRRWIGAAAAASEACQQLAGCSNKPCLPQPLGAFSRPLPNRLLSACTPFLTAPQVQLAWRVFFPEQPKSMTPKEEGKQRLRMILVADRWVGGWVWVAAFSSSGSAGL